MYSFDYRSLYPHRYDCFMGEIGNRQKMARKDPLVQQHAADFGSALRRLRKSQHLSQSWLAAMIESKHPRISGMEHGLVDVRISDVVKLARALDVNPGDLLDLGAYELADFPPRPPKGHARL